MKIKIIVFPLLALIAGTLLVACGGTKPAQTTPEVTLAPVQADDTIVAEGRVEPIRYVEIGFTAGGIVGEVLVNEGDTIAAGDVIARLSNADTRTLSQAQTDSFKKLVDAYEAVRVAQLDLDNFDVNSDFHSMTPEQAVSISYEKLEKARADYEPYKYLNPRNDRVEDPNCKIRNGIESCKDTSKFYQKALDDAWDKYRSAITWMERVSAVNDAQAQLEEAQHDYAALQDTADFEKLAGTRALLANGELRSPFNGTVAKLDIKAGEPAVSGQTAVTVADFSSWVVKTTDLTEIDVVDIKNGQTAVVTLDALPNSPFEARVLSIGQTFDEKQGDIVYEVKLLLANVDPSIRWGMTAEVKFTK